MSVQLIISLLSQAISILTGVISVPWLMRALGAEAYGLIGIYAIVQTWLQWLDAGVSLTASRQAARHRGGEVSDAQINALVRYASFLFFAIGIVAFFALLIFQDDVVHGKRFDVADGLGDVRVALCLMFLAAILRWLAGLYKGLLAGFGYLSVVAIVNATSAVGRNIAVFPLLTWLGVSVESYFVVHVVVGLIELLFSVIMVVHVMRKNSGVPGGSKGPFTIEWLLGVFRYSGLVAVNTAAVVFVNQIDRIMQLGVMTLKDFGIYSVVMSIGTVILSVGSPVASVMIPRMTSLVAKDGVLAARDPYVRVSVLMSSLLVSVAMAAVWCAPGLLKAFGVLDTDASGFDLMLRLYLIGNVFYVISFFPAFLCHAAGDVVLLLVANVILGIGMLLGMILGRDLMGSNGVALAWCAINALNLIVWTAFVHRRYFGTMYLFGAIKYVLFPALLSCLCVTLMATTQCLNWLRTGGELLGHWFVLIQLLAFSVGGVLAGFVTLKLLLLRRGQRRFA